MRPHTYDLDSLGWTSALAAAFEPHAAAGLVAGRLGGEHRGRLVVYLERGERLAEPSGRLRRSHPGHSPLVGDWVACRLPRGDGPTVIDAVLPRTTTFQRVAANVDLALVLSSLAGDEGLDAVRALVEPGRTAVLVGLSDAARSTFLDRLVGRRDTTWHRRLFLLPRGGLILDVPGNCGLGLRGARDGLAGAFGDIAVVP